MTMEAFGLLAGNVKEKKKVHKKENEFVFGKHFF